MFFLVLLLFFFFFCSNVGIWIALFFLILKERKNQKISKILSSHGILEELNIPSVVIQWAVVNVSSFILFNFYFLPFFILLCMWKSTVPLLFSVICRFLLFQNLTFEPPWKKRNIICLCLISNLSYYRDNVTQSVLSCESLAPEVVPPYHGSTLI